MTAIKQSTTPSTINTQKSATTEEVAHWHEFSTRVILRNHRETSKEN